MLEVGYWGWRWTPWEPLELGAPQHQPSLHPVPPSPQGGESLDIFSTLLFLPFFHVSSPVSHLKVGLSCCYPIQHIMWLTLFPGNKSSTFLQVSHKAGNPTCQIFQTTSSETIVHKKNMFASFVANKKKINSSRIILPLVIPWVFLCIPGQSPTPGWQGTLRGALLTRILLRHLPTFDPPFFYGLKSGLSDTLKTACKLGRVSRHGLEPKSRKYMRWLLDGCTSDFFYFIIFSGFLFSVKWPEPDVA